MNDFDWEKYKTDKITGHGYQNIYNEFLDRNKKIIVEFGSRAGSAQMWCEYFNSGSIIGCDIIPFSYSNIRFNFLNLNMNSSNEYEKLPTNIDVIIEDGPHTSKSQHLMLSNCLNKMADGGVIVFEDLHCTEIGGTSNNDYNQFLGDAGITINELLKEWQNGIFNTYKYIDSTDFRNKKLDINIRRGVKKRWSTQSLPSEVIIVKVKG